MVKEIGTDCSRARGRRRGVISPRAILQWNRRPVYAGVAPRVIVITSGKGGVSRTNTTANLGMCLARLNFKVVGGVGKTTTTANLGRCLARLKFKVAAIDADVRLDLGPPTWVGESGELHCYGSSQW
ncbi:unnamed protein product [Calypogeia fissa]